MTHLEYSILVADDNPEVVQSVSSYLEQLASKFGDRLRILRANSATEVLTLLSLHAVDVLFLDYHFEGGMSGDEILDVIQDPFCCKLIVLMSGRDPRELEGTLIKRHKHFGERFRFLRKPFDYLETQAKYLEIEQFFLSRPLPFPLAHARDSMFASSTALGRITAVKDVMEALAKYAVAVLMADANRLGIKDKLTLNVSLNLNLTFGAWLTWLNNLLDYVDKMPNLMYMPEIAEVFSAEGGGRRRHLHLMQKFKDQVRDAELGHGFVKEEAWYSSLVDEYAAGVESLMRDCAFASRYILLIPESVDFCEINLDRFEYTVRVLMGAETRFAMTRLQTSARMRLREVYLYSPGGNVLSLHPYYAYSVCKSCSLGRLYSLDKISATEITYNTFCNHRLRESDSKAVFNAEFAQLTTSRRDAARNAP